MSVRGRYPRTLAQVDEHARRHGRVSFTLAEWRQIRERGFSPEPVPRCTGARAGRACTALDGCNLRGCPYFTEPCSRPRCDGGCPSIGCDATGAPEKITT